MTQNQIQKEKQREGKQVMQYRGRPELWAATDASFALLYFKNTFLLCVDVDQVCHFVKINPEQPATNN